MRALLPPSLAVLLLLCAGAVVADPIDQVLGLERASLVVGDSRRPSLAQAPDRSMIPASTMKLLTALAAIDRWGLAHRFETRFYRGDDGRLWVQGGGDPYLVSEELDRAVAGLQRAGLRSAAGIGLDAGLFGATVAIPGRSSSSNPYDAPVTALAVNFNTVSLRVAGGRVESGEAQTPMTPTAQRLGRGLGDGSHRINLRDGDTALAQFAEVLGVKLEAAGIAVGADVVRGRVPPGAEPVYRHRNSRTLEQVVAAMLEYSTNFVANDLFLLLGEREGQTSMAQARRALEAWARQRFGWRRFTIDDGAGLSRENRISARQLIDVLEAFAPYRRLLPAQDGDPAVRAKTGTLSGVSTYAGYVRRGGVWEPFSLMINQPVAYDLRLRVASALARAPTLAAY
jgi:D-alanyl-D-alanine carboxypeptidase/D-alanyl-D-alanine-endopeptidase (penicillin-binding protein 4)